MMTVETASSLFASAQSALSTGDFLGARRALMATRALVGDHPAVLNLIAIVEKNSGNLDAAHIAFAGAIKQSPNDPHIRTNFANLLLAQSREADAIREFRTVIEQHPDFSDARVNLALVLHRKGLLDEALALLAPLSRCTKDARTLTLYGQVLADLARLDEAATSFDAALAIDPKRTTALAGRARVALRRGEQDVVRRYDLAILQAPQHPSLSVGKALALEAMGDSAAAMSILERLLQGNPKAIEIRVEVARIASEAGEIDSALEGFGAAARRQDSSVEFHLAYLNALAHADRYHVIIAHIESLDDQMAKLAPFQSYLLAAHDALGHQVEANRIAISLDAVPSARVWLARHYLRWREPNRAVECLDRNRANIPLNVSEWAHLALAWRATSDPRLAWLTGDRPLYRTFDLKTDPAEMQRLADTLGTLHRSRSHPLGQSVRGGTQTRGALFERSEQVLRNLEKILVEAIREYQAQLPPVDREHPVLAYRDATLRITGSWSVRLRDAGFHTPHVHPLGVLSSAFYVAVDTIATPDDPQAGWLELGRPPPELMLDLPPLATIEPKPGRLALFPSYLFHGTRPFPAGERLTVAFDVTA